jgi:hypothetical protein
MATSLRGRSNTWLWRMQTISLEDIHHGQCDQGYFKQPTLSESLQSAVLRLQNTDVIYILYALMTIAVFDTRYRLLKHA